MILRPPILSIADPAESGEGSIDPLGLQATYERLAERVYPYLTVRMSRPRFLTAIAVAARVCEGLENEVAADGVTPPWLVHEWHVVEAFGRREALFRGGEFWGIAGSQKVRRVLRTGRRLGAHAYLKTPTVFGFTGIYKTLAVGLEIVTDTIELDDGGFEVLSVWEREQKLSRFLDGGEGAGAKLRKSLRRAVEAGLEKGHTSQRGGWAVWDQIVTHLNPARAGRKEAAWIFERLANSELRTYKLDVDASRMRREVLLRLDANGPVTSRAEEAAFFRGILKKGSGASGELRERLDAIDSYEALCRPINDSFRLIMHLSTAKGFAPVSESEFRSHPLTKRLAAAIPRSVERIMRAFEGTGWEAEVATLLDRFGTVDSAKTLYGTVLERHHDAQRSKPPDGKRPWVEGVRDGVVARPQYHEDREPAGVDEYVHDYRTRSASQFLVDLERFRE